MRIDAHQHFWVFDPVRDSWITDEMALIQKDFLPEDLAPLLVKNGFDGSVAVQASQTEEETEFLAALAAKNSLVKGVVGWVDLRAENIRDRLGYFAQNPAVKGFRHVLQGEPQRDLMLEPSFVRGIAALEAHNFTYDILIFPDQLKHSRELVSRFPNQKFVIDHLAKPYIKKGALEEWKQDLEAMAGFPNVWCKVSGMVTEADWKMWSRQTFVPYLDVVVEAFGTERLLFGSDWPVCQVAATYEEVVGIVENYFSSFTAAEQDRLFGGNAVEFYKL